MASEPAGIASGLDVGVLVDVDARADGDALGQIVVAARDPHADERLGVGAHAAAQLIAEAGSDPFSFRRNSRSMVPSAEAANTTPRQVKRRRSVREATPWNSRCALRSRRCHRLRRRADVTSTTRVSANTRAPCFSAR